MLAIGPLAAALLSARFHTDLLRHTGETEYLSTYLPELLRPFAAKSRPSPLNCAALPLEEASRAQALAMATDAATTLAAFARTSGQWHALIDCCGRHRRPVARSN